MRRRTVLIISAALLMVASLPAQQILWERMGPNQAYPATLDNTWGGDIACLGDVDGDGASDILVSSEYSWNGLIQNAGHVCVLSGATGNTIYEWHGLAYYDEIQSFGVLGDLDQDGVQDFAMWKYGPSGLHATLVSGATGSELPTSPTMVFGWSMGSVGDLNLDGINEFGSTVLGGMYLYMGPQGAGTMWIALANPYQSFLGQNMLPFADMDADGVSDVLLSAPGQNCYQFQGLPNFLPLAGHVSILSGASGMELRGFSGSGVCDNFGGALAAPGDYDGDGVRDIVASDFGMSVLKVLSSATGALIATVPIQTGASNILPLVTVGDVDMDGYADYAMYFGINVANVVTEGFRVVSGASHSVIESASALLSEGNLGRSLALIGDVNGDGFPDLAVGMPHYAFGPVAGRVRVYSLLPPGIAPYGSGCPLANGTVPAIGASGAAIPGGSIRINLSQVTPGVSVALIGGSSSTSFGTTPLPWDLSGIGVPGCALLASMDVFLVGTTDAVSPGIGTKSFVVSVPTSPVLSGMTFYVQWAIENPLGSALPVGMSRGLSITVQ
jgi:FG-GAP repeat